MNSRSGKQGLVWGGLLILFGVVGLVEVYADLTAWGWAGILAAGGLGAFAVYLTDRSDWGLLIPAYVMWVVAGLIALIMLNILRDPFVSSYVFAAILLPFVAVYLRNRKQWWALIPAYVMLAVGVMVVLIELEILRDPFISSYVFAAILLPFLVAYLRNRKQWWALIPVYVMLAVGVMVVLIEQGILGDLLVPAYVMFAVAVPFYAVYTINTRLWWALVPAGIMTIMGLAFVVAQGMFQFVAAIVLLLVGALILVRQFIREQPAAPQGELTESSDE